MGLGRVMWTGCLGMCCLIPMAWLSFNVLDLGAAVTNGLLVDLGTALETIFAAVIPSSFSWAVALIPILVEGTMGVTMLIFFPLHWALYYRPDEIGFAFAIIIPWILSGALTSALFCKTTKKGFDTGLAIGVGYAILVGAVPFALSGLINAIFHVSFDIMPLLDGVFSGMTDLPYVAAVLTSCLEGGLIGGIFGAFIGSIKYDPSQTKSKAPKGKKQPEPKVKSEKFGGSASTAQPKIGARAGSTEFCPNCGAKIMVGDPFCPNCGTKV